MARELRFRAWDGEQKQMLYKDFCVIPTSPGWSATKYFTPKEFESDPVKWFDCTAFDWADGLMMTGNYKLMQYTGLKDKKGNEIYEGDIVKDTMVNVKTNKRGTVKRLFEIYWDTDTASFWQRLIDDPSNQFRSGYNFAAEKECEVIGNIYENPELIMAMEVPNG